MPDSIWVFNDQDDVIEEWELDELLSYLNSEDNISHLYFSFTNEGAHAYRDNSHTDLK